MAVHSGFFNSSEGDRKYNAEHFSRFFDGLICDGVYVNYPEKDDNGNYTAETDRGFYVSPGSGIAVNVARGRCFFDGYWMYTDAVTVINLSSLVPSNSLSKKLVAIFIDVDTSLEGREIKFLAVAGNEVANDDQHTADPPTPANTNSHKQYPIALIAMNGNVSAINTANIYRFDVLYGDSDYRKAYFAKTASVEALLEYSSRTKSEIDARFGRIEAPTFTEASTLANINSGENINTLWGKIKKVFTDLIFNPGSGNAKKAWIVGSDGKGSFKAIKDTFDSDALFSRSAPGIVPTAPSGSGTDKFLREDGSWFAPVGTNTNAQTVGNVEIAYNNGYPSYKYNGAWRRFKDPTGTASAGDVLSGKTFANAASDTLVTGTMSNRGSATRSINAGSTSTIAAGYYSGGTITANRYHDDNTYSFGSNTGGTVDLGVGHNYRRVNAGNVYQKGKDDQYTACYNAWYQPRYDEGYNNGLSQGRSDWYPYNFIFTIAATAHSSDPNITVDFRCYQNSYDFPVFNTAFITNTIGGAYQWVFYGKTSYGGGLKVRS